MLGKTLAILFALASPKICRLPPCSGSSLPPHPLALVWLTCVLDVFFPISWLDASQWISAPTLRHLLVVLISSYSMFVIWLVIVLKYYHVRSCYNCLGLVFIALVHCPETILASVPCYVSLFNASHDCYFFMDFVADCGRREAKWNMINSLIIGLITSWDLYLCVVFIQPHITWLGFHSISVVMFSTPYPKHTILAGHAYYDTIFVAIGLDRYTRGCWIVPNNWSLSVAPHGSEQPTGQFLWNSPPLRNWSMMNQFITETLNSITINLAHHHSLPSKSDAYPHWMHKKGWFISPIFVIIHSLLQVAGSGSIVHRHICVICILDIGIPSYDPPVELCLARDELGTLIPPSSSKARAQTASWLAQIIVLSILPIVCILYIMT